MFVLGELSIVLFGFVLFVMMMLVAFGWRLDVCGGFAVFGCWWFIVGCVLLDLLFVFVCGLCLTCWLCVVGVLDVRFCGLKFAVAVMV